MVLGKWEVYAYDSMWGLCRFVLNNDHPGFVRNFPFKAFLRDDPSHFYIGDFSGTDLPITWKDKRTYRYLYRLISRVGPF